MPKKRVLFVCTHNSARSQMAEGMLRTWSGDIFDVFSAGTEPGEIRPEAIAVMDEIAIDIRGQRSKSLDQFAGQEFEWLITVCDRARTECSNIPGVTNPAHWGIQDPSSAEGTDEERLSVFREVRDDIRNRLHIFILAASRDDVPRQAPTAVRG
ncbi:MAG: arsenate reductase ArsC [Candidatus Limnocylindrales bacterium]